MPNDDAFEARVEQAEDRAEERNEALEDRSTNRVEEAKEKADSDREESEARSTVHTDEAEVRLSSEIHVLREAVIELTDRHEAQDELLRRKQKLIEETRKLAKRALVTAVASVAAVALVIGLGAALWNYVQNQNETRDEVLCPMAGLFVDAGKRPPPPGISEDDLKFRKFAFGELDKIYSSDSIDCPPR